MKYQRIPVEKDLFHCIEEPADFASLQVTGLSQYSKELSEIGLNNINLSDKHITLNTDEKGRIFPNINETIAYDGRIKPAEFKTKLKYK